MVKSVARTGGIILLGAVGFGLSFAAYRAYEEWQRVEVLWNWANEANCRVWPERCTAQTQAPPTRVAPSTSVPAAPEPTPKGEKK